MKLSAILCRGVAALLLATAACGTDVASQAGVTDVVDDTAADDLDTNDVQGDSNGADLGPGSEDDDTSDIRIDDVGADDTEALPDTTVEPDGVPDTKPVTTGTCVPANGVCCDGPSDCPSALECVKLDGPEYGGTCKPIPTPGSCWSDADCGGDACLGASFCACGCEEQNDQLGTCAGP